MAEGGRSPKQVIHIHIHNTSNEETIIQEQHVGNRTEIHGSSIGSVIAGQPEQGAEQNDPAENGPDVAEGVEQINLAKTPVPRARKLVKKRKDSNLEFDSEKTSNVMPGRGNKISGRTRKLTLQESGQFIHAGAFQVSDVLTLLEKEKISTSHQIFHAILHSDVTGDKKVVAKITPADKLHQREAKIHFSVPHHKNIVERIITDIFNFRGQPSIYIVMECCDCNLYDHIKSQVSDGVQFDAQKYLSITRQIVVALNFLHSHKVVHGDLKPSNVLLLLDKNIVKLCDFGLSRAISGDKTSTQLTLPQGGTMGWLAPEVLEGTTKFGFKSDIFPLGLVSFYCLSYGKHPYGDKPVSWNHYIVNGENRNLDGMLIPDADAAIAVLQSMLQQNPADRPTVEDILKHRVFASKDQDDGVISKGVERTNLSRTTEADKQFCHDVIGENEDVGIERANIPKIFEYSVANLRNFFEENKGQDDGTSSKNVERMNLPRSTESDSSANSRPSHGKLKRIPLIKTNAAFKAQKNPDGLSLEPGVVWKDDLSSASSSKSSTEKEDSTAKSQTSLNYYKAKYDFLRRNDNEIDLVKGEIVVIVNKELHHHGWWKGIKEENGKLVKGLLPCDYVAELTADEAEDYVKQLQADSLQDSEDTSKEKDSLAKVCSEKTGQPTSDDERKLKITFLSKRIFELLKKSKHSDASKLLEELTSLQPTKELVTSLQMAECFLYLGKEMEACEAIDAVRHIIVTPHALSADDVFSLACDLCQKSFYIRAIILFRIASDLYKANASLPDDIVNAIRKCIRKTDDVAQQLVRVGGKSRVIGLNIAVEYLEEMVLDLSDVKNAEPGNKTLNQAKSLHCLGENYGLANEYEKRLKSLQAGIEMLESQFGSNASKYSVYGLLLNNTGSTYDKLGKFSDAEKYYVKSLDAKHKAVDWADERKRQNSIERSKRRLEKTRAKLSKI